MLSLLQDARQWLIKWDKPKVPTSDWCSAAPDVVLGWQLWRACYWHDQAYRKGYVKGYGRIRSRQEADDLFYELVRRRSNAIIAYAYWLGVHYFGETAWNRHENDRVDFLKDHNVSKG